MFHQSAIFCNKEFFVFTYCLKSKVLISNNHNAKFFRCQILQIAKKKLLG